MMARFWPKLGEAAFTLGVRDKREVERFVLVLLVILTGI